MTNSRPEPELRRDADGHRRRTRVRLLWDENLSPRVPEALRVLRFNTTWVGATDTGAPARGSTDADLVAFAKRTNQVIVTMNHDMMTLCHEADQRFVWLDPRGRKLGLEEQVLLVFTQIATWEEILSESRDGCVRARRTKCERITGAEAARLATRRMRELERRKRVRARSPKRKRSETTLLD